jgi:hypothetical protein
MSELDAPCGACYRCLEPTFPELVLGDPRTRYQPYMIVCPNCGNKRCPHATNHNNACTHSNRAGQPGSRYGAPLEDRVIAAGWHEYRYPRPATDKPSAAFLRGLAAAFYELHDQGVQFIYPWQSASTGTPQPGVLAEKIDKWVQKEEQPARSGCSSPGNPGSARRASVSGANRADTLSEEVIDA